MIWRRGYVIAFYFTYFEYTSLTYYLDLFRMRVSRMKMLMLPLFFLQRPFSATVRCHG